MVNSQKMDFNLTEISFVNVVFVKNDSKLTIGITRTKGINQEIVLFTKRRFRNKKHGKSTENISHGIIKKNGFNCQKNYKADYQQRKNLGS
jgi:hypothetical protein